MGLNTVVYEVELKQIFPNIKDLVGDASGDWEQGDLLVYDSTNNVIRKPASEGELSTLVGMATQDAASGKPSSPYVTAVDAAQAIPQLNGPIYGVVAAFVLETGTSIDAGDLVYAKPSLGARHVAASGSKAIGVYQGATIAGSSAGDQVEVLLGARYPADALRF